MSHSGLHCRVYGNMVRDEMAFVMSDLTLLYICFAILFCQKKSRKFVSRSPGFSLKTLILGVRKYMESTRLYSGGDLSVVATRIHHHMRNVPATVHTIHVMSQNFTEYSVTSCIKLSSLNIR